MVMGTLNCHDGKFRKEGSVPNSREFPAGQLYNYIPLREYASSPAADNNGSWAVNPHCNPSSHCGRYRYLDGRGQHLVKLAINSVPLSTLTVLQVILHPLQDPCYYMANTASGSTPGPINSIAPLTAKYKEWHKLLTHYPTTISSDSRRVPLITVKLIEKIHKWEFVELSALLEYT